LCLNSLIFVEDVLAVAKAHARLFHPKMRKRLKGLCLPPDGLRVFVGTDDDRRTCRFAAAHEADIMKAKLAGNDFPQIAAA